MQEKLNELDEFEEKANKTTEDVNNTNANNEKNAKENYGDDWKFEISPKEKFVEMLNSISCLTDKTKENILKYLEKTDFYEAPASSKFHNNVPMGLVKHSVNVALELQELTIKNGIVWQHEDSPILVGLLHDICKIFTYKIDYKNVILSEDPKTHKKVWGKQPFYTINNDSELIRYGIHGDRSVALLLMLRTSSKDFNSQELACIRYHMGNTQEGEGQSFSKVCAIEPNVLWTNIADNIASLKEPIIK